MISAPILISNISLLEWLPEAQEDTLLVTENYT